MGQPSFGARESIEEWGTRCQSLQGFSVLPPVIPTERLLHTLSQHWTQCTVIIGLCVCPPQEVTYSGQWLILFYVLSTINVTWMNEWMNENTYPWGLCVGAVCKLFCCHGFYYQFHFLKYFLSLCLENFEYLWILYSRKQNGKLTWGKVYFWDCLHNQWLLIVEH